MDTGVGVLSARVRVEEKQNIEALGQAGFGAMPVPPPSTPIRFTAPPPSPGEQAGGDGSFTDARILIDRCKNRTLMHALTPILRASGAQVIDAGLAAVGSRLQVASVLAEAGLPRPDSLLATAEETGVEAASELGFPTTLLAMSLDKAETPLLDRDTAEAVIEHRIVLGTDAESLMLLQAGAPSADSRTMVHVVAGQAVGASGADATPEAYALAEAAADALGAALIGIEIAQVDGKLVVWDAAPAPDFRATALRGSLGVPQAIVDAVRTLDAAMWNGGAPTYTPLTAYVGQGQQASWDARRQHGISISA